MSAMTTEAQAAAEAARDAAAERYVKAVNANRHTRYALRELALRQRPERIVREANEILQAAGLTRQEAQA